MLLRLETKQKNAIEVKVDKYKGLFGVPFLIGNKKMEPKMLREITNDAITPKKRDSKVQNDLYERSNDEFEDEEINSVVITEF